MSIRDHGTDMGAAARHAQVLLVGHALHYAN
jgi:hypothetical protein